MAWPRLRPPRVSRRSRAPMRRGLPRACLPILKGIRDATAPNYAESPGGCVQSSRLAVDAIADSIKAGAGRRSARVGHAKGRVDGRDNGSHGDAAGRELKVCELKVPVQLAVWSIFAWKGAPNGVLRFFCSSQYGQN